MHYFIAISLGLYVFASPLLFASAGQQPVSNQPYPVIGEKVLNFKPDFCITEQYDADKTVLEKLKPLFYEADQSENPQNDVYHKAIRELDGQEIMLMTSDNMRISTLFFQRPNAPINIIYIPGYFFNLTPPKEWCTPFAALHPDFNILALDWRGVGSSEGDRGFLKKNAFGKNAHPDIQAAIDFMRKKNNNPTILVGFCFGAAMALNATIQAQKNGHHRADALVLNCIFSKFQNQFDRAVIAEDRFLYKMLLRSGIAEMLLEWQLNGSIFDINPIEMIKNITVPCYFEHYTHDPFAIIEEGIAVYQAATCPKMFTRSDLGRHVRIHTKAPYQYRQGFVRFLETYNFLPSGYQV